MSVAATVLDEAPPGVNPGELARGAVEPFGDDWSFKLNAVARWVFDENRGAWLDFRRAWLDLRHIFGPASALRLLDLAEIAELVPADAD